jgi:hypothetical protein
VRVLAIGGGRTTPVAHPKINPLIFIFFRGFSHESGHVALGGGRTTPKGQTLTIFFFFVFGQPHFVQMSHPSFIFTNIFFKVFNIFIFFF